jgi:hypothetical protein
VNMRNTNGSSSERPVRGPAADNPVALLAAAGLRAERVERCPDPNCPVCSGGRRVAA